jgi:hypothetical protein
MVKYQIESEELGIWDIEMEADDLDDVRKKIMMFIDIQELK